MKPLQGAKRKKQLHDSRQMSAAAAVYGPTNPPAPLNPRAVRYASVIGLVPEKEAQYRELLGRYRTGPVPAEVVELGWQLEELRVAEFAQTLGVKGSVSVQRIARQLAVLSRGG